MQNIIKALKYKVARDNVTYYALIGAAVMMIYVAVVYAFTFFSRMFTDRKEADSINKALRNKYRDEK